MILMSIWFDYVTRKLQKYVNCRVIDLKGVQNHVICYFIRNMGFKWPIHCTNLGYKLVVMVWKTIWMFLMFIKLDNDTRKLKKYVKLRDIDILGSQNHVLYYFIRNMVFKWSILHQYWKQISFNCLENNSNVSHVKKRLDLDTRKLTFGDVKIKFPRNCKGQSTASFPK